MIQVKLTSILVQDQGKARDFYTRVLGFQIKHDIPMGEVSWLTVVSPASPDGVELLLEPTGHPASRVYQKALYDDGVPLTALSVDDISAEYARLTELGVQFKAAPRPMGPTTVANLDDTCGNWIQLYQLGTHVQQ